MSMSRTKILAGIVLVIIVVAAVGVYFSTSKPPLSVSITSSASVGTAGSPISFTAIVTPSSASIGTVLWNFGDGVNQTVNGATTTHTFSNGGRYLILAQVTATYQNFLLSSSLMGSNSMALFSLIVQPSLDQAANEAVPNIILPFATNPTAPIFNVGDVVHPVGVFAELPANSNWTIQQYVWNFGNGNTQTVAASSTGLPSANVTATYSNPGVYPLSLTLITGSNGATLSVTTVRTVAVQSSTIPFALLTASSGVLYPGVITSAEVTAGPYSWDPQIEAESIGNEQIDNIFQTIVAYNGSSTTSFIPWLAAALPTRDNGGISPDYTTYTFQIRGDQYFSNGDPVTAYDVWFTMARCIAFVNGSPGTGGWVLTQFLVPGAQNGTVNYFTANTWDVATKSVTYDNASNTVTFHFNRPMPQTFVYQILSYSLGTSVVDSRYAWSVGAGFNQQNWDSYMNQANEANYNTKMQWSPVGSGPFMVQSYTPGQFVELVPNPHYPGVPGIPKQNDTIVIDWVKTADTALLMLQDGQADSASGLLTSDFPAVQKLQAQGLVNIYSFPTLTVYYYIFNINIDKDLESTVFGSGFNEPSNYFADVPTRLAWINAYDYAGYLDNILGNAKYNAAFGLPLQGFLPSGMIGAPTSDELGGLPTQNLAAARGNFSRSAWADQKITVPIVEGVGDTVNIAGAEEWAGILAQISGGNITAKVVQLSFEDIFANQAQDANPMGALLESCAADYPDGSAYAQEAYGEGGFMPSGSNWLVSNFATLPPSTPNDVVYVNGTAYTQDKVYSWINGNVTLGVTSVDPAVRHRAYVIMERLAIDMGLYAYLYQCGEFWYFRSWLKGYQMQENPIVNGCASLVFYWLTKD